MLGKIFKHEMKSTSKMFIPMMLGFLIITLLCKFSFEISASMSFNNNITELITIIFFFLYFIYIVALFVMTSVFIVMHFYKTMVSDQGYLTNTLPVKASTLINAKLFSAIIWQIITILLFALSLLVFTLGHISADDIEELWIQFGIFYQEVSPYINLPLFITEMTIVSIVSLVSGPLMLYASIALGHLFQKHRILFAVISYFTIYIIIQIGSTFLLGICGYPSMTYNQENGFFASSRFEGYMLITTVFSIVCTAGYYTITNYIFSRKLNLD